MAKTPKTIEIKVSAVDYELILEALDTLTASLLDIGDMFNKAADLNAAAAAAIRGLAERDA